MFEATAAFAPFDYHRVPYARVDGPAAAPGWARMSWRGDGAARTVRWPLAARMAAGTPRARLGSYRLGAIPIAGHVVAETAAPTWEAVHEISDERGRVVAAIRRSPRGDLLLPFDPGEVLESYWSERYRTIGSGARRARLTRRGKELYYRARPLLPRAAQLRMRRAFTRVQAQSAFPAWPAETALHDLHDLLLGLLAEVAGEPLPRIAPWPDGHAWALVLSHDVEAEPGYRSTHLLAEVERRYAMRSSWNLVARRYEVDDAFVAALVADGHEVGVHGLHHDGRDIAELGRRLPEMHRWRDRWGAAGFRSPATNRDWDRMARLGFDYDSSSPDTDPYEPDPGGCCSLLPFFNRGIVELPITLPQDHTLYEVLQRERPAEWFEKTRIVRERGGMALLLTHPDYMLAEERLADYDAYLAAFAPDRSAWCPLPRDVAQWWRERAASSITRVGGEWVVTGPAAQRGRVELVGVSPAAAAAPPAMSAG